MKTYEEFLNLFKKENPKPIINLKEKVDNFLKETDVEDIIYALHSVTDELGKPYGIEYFLNVGVYRRGSLFNGRYGTKLIEEGNRFIPKDPILKSIPNSMWNTEECEASFEIEFVFYEGQGYDISTGSDSSDQNYELLKDFMIRIMDEYKFEESDFQYMDRLRLIFTF